MFVLGVLVAVVNLLSIQVLAQSITTRQFSNTTTSGSKITPAVTSCPFNCDLVYQPLRSRLVWTSMTANTTITAATVIAFVNNGTNSTSYSTKFNTELGGFTLPQTTNAQGTVTMAVTDYDPVLGRNVTKTAAYPDVLDDYDTTLAWSGTLPTSANGSTQCLVRPTETTQLLPSHPFLPEVSASQTADVKDPKGWLYSPSWEILAVFTDISTLFPSFAPLSCSRGTQTFPAPASAVFTAAFATVTSTLHIGGPPPAPSPPQPALNPDPPAKPPTNPQPPPGPTAGSGVTNPQQPASQPNKPGSPSPQSAPQVPANPLSQPGGPAAPNPGSQSGGSPPQNQPGGAFNGLPPLGPSSQPDSPGPLNPGSSGGSGPVPQPNQPANTPGQPGASIPNNAPGQVSSPAGEVPVNPSVGANPPSNQGTVPLAPVPQAPGDVNVPATPNVGVQAPGNGNQAVPANNAGSANVVPALGPAPLPQISIGGSVATATQQIGFVNNGVTIALGAAVATISATPVSVVPGGSLAVVGGRTQTLTPAAPLIVGSQVFTPVQGTPFFVLGSQTLTPGAPAAILSSNTVSIAPGGSFAVVNGITQSIAPPAGPSQAPQLTIGAQVVTANSQGAFVVGSQTLQVGGPALTISGTPVSFAPGAAFIGGSTQSLGGATGGVNLPSNAVAFSVGSSTVTANPQGQFVIAGQTLVPGGTAISVSGTQVSLAANGQNVVVGGSTQAVSTVAGASGRPSAFTAAGATFTTGPNGAYQFAGTTLAPGGPAATISGTTVSLGPGGSYVVVNGATTTLKATGTSIPGVSAFATGSSGARGTPTGTAAGTQYTGAAISSHVTQRVMLTSLATVLSLLIFQE